MNTNIKVNGYPIGWEWLDKVPLEDFTLLMDVFATMTDNTDTYDFASYKYKTIPGWVINPVIEVNRKGLAEFLDEDQGYSGGIREFGNYVAMKALHIKSEEEYRDRYNEILELTNQPKDMTNMEFLSKLIGDSAIDTWTSWETQEINNLPSLEKLPANVNPYKFLYSSYERIIILLDNKYLEENPNLAKNAPKYQSNGVQIWEEESLEVIPLD